MPTKYIQTIDEVFRVLGSFAHPYEVDRKRFAYSLQLLDERHLICGKRILDLGSGIGIMAIAFHLLGAEVIGLDKFIFPQAFDNPYRVNEFEKLKDIWNQVGITVTEADILKPLPFTTNDFDLVNCDCTVEHLLNSPKSLFCEVLRILRPGGTFLVTTPNFVNLLRRVRFLLGRSPHWDLREYFDQEERYTGHRREFTVSELSKQLSWSGFSILTWKTQNSFFNWKRLFNPRKCVAHIVDILSLPFPRLREMIFVLAKKPSRKT